MTVMNSPAYPNFTARALTDVLTPHTEVIQQHSGTGQLVFATRGGRLLGLYPRADGPNALWVNPALQETLAAGGWLIGGERLWIAPELDFFYRDPANFDGVHVPVAIDPGHYERMEKRGEFKTLQLSSTFDLYDFHQQQTYFNSCLERIFQTISDPYATGMDYVGVHIQERVAVPNAKRRFCAWSIAQVYIPSGTCPATALIPTSEQADMLSYFDAIPAEQAVVQANYISFKLDASAIYKLAVRPEHLNHGNPVKALCLMPCPDTAEWFCVVKRSQDMPRTQDECVDVARNPATTAKGVVQSYNHGPQAGESATSHRFGEIEIQLNPAKQNSAGLASSTGGHELLAYSGSRKQILLLAQRLLQLAQPPAVYAN